MILRLLILTMTALAAQPPEVTVLRGVPYATTASDRDTPMLPFPMPLLDGKRPLRFRRENAAKYGVPAERMAIPRAWWS